MNNKVYVGYSTGPFGLKGEIKIFSESNHNDLIFKVGSVLYIDDKSYEIKTCRYHKNAYLVSFKFFEDINKVDLFLKKEIFVCKEDLNLEDNEYLTSELYSLDIVYNNEIIGKVEDILYNKKDTFIKSGSLIIPLNEKYFDRVSIKERKIYVLNVGELRI